MTLATRLHELSTQYGLTAPASTRLREFLDLLACDPLAPSSVTAADSAVDVHVADSLSALVIPGLRRARHVVDIGSGAGLPGLVLAIALPHAHVTLLESSRRKCQFIARAIDATAAHNAEVVCARAELWPSGAAVHDVVTARALAPLAVLCEYASPLLARAGLLIAWKGTTGDRERQEGDRAARQLGLGPADVVRVEPYPGSAAHHLHMYSKIADTPSRFPRRVGVARKQPLGGAG